MIPFVRFFSEFFLDNDYLQRTLYTGRLGLFFFYSEFILIFDNLFLLWMFHQICMWEKQIPIRIWFSTGLDLIQ